MPLLFSYGSLQGEQVQLSTFSRLFDPRPDALLGFERAMVKIDDPAIVEAVGRTHHANVRRGGDPQSRVDGVVLDVTDAELAQVDAYESAFSYQRMETALASGGQAWVYVHAPSVADS